MQLKAYLKKAIEDENYHFISDKLVTMAREKAGQDNCGIIWLKEQLKKAPVKFQDYFRSKFAF